MSHKCIHLYRDEGFFSEILKHFGLGTRRVKNIFLSEKQYFYPSSAQIGMFQEIEGNTMDADALASCLIRSSAAIVLTLYNEEVLVFHEHSRSGRISTTRAILMLKNQQKWWWWGPVQPETLQIMECFSWILTHFGLDMPHGDIELGQHWLR